jgi:hypothetical protein
VLHNCSTDAQTTTPASIHAHVHTQAHTHIKCGKRFKEINACENSNTVKQINHVTEKYIRDTFKRIKEEIIFTTESWR